MASVRQAPNREKLLHICWAIFGETMETTTNKHPLRLELKLRNDEFVRFPYPAVMGIINCSPNSFYGAVENRTDALLLAEKMVEGGANIIDIGGEATNPSVNLVADKPAVAQEIEAVVPVIKAIKQRYEILVSIDTSQPEVMKAAIDAGADMINDQRSLWVEGALDVVAKANVPVCLMHFFDQKRVPNSSSPEQMLNTIKSELQAAVSRCLAAGISRDRLVIDPGFGGGNFRKSSQENFYLLAHLQELKEMDLPILAGWSRKSMIGDALGGVSAEKRLYGSIAAAMLLAEQGAAIIRVHDVAETVDAMKVFREYQREL